MTALITTIDQASAEWLTAVLRGAGTLGQATVRDVRQRGNPAFNSTVAHLELTYSDDPPAAAPRRLLLKLNADQAGAEEVGFYRLVAAQPASLPMLARCYAAEYDAASGNSYCLLADLSDTHFTPVTRDAAIALEGVPTDAQLDQMIDALAGLHAYWWEHPALGSVPKVAEVRWWYRDADFYQRHIERRAGEWARFIADVGAWFPADLHVLYEHTLASLPQLWERFLKPRVTTFQHLTICNGDCYLPQFLCPKDPSLGGAYLVDFQDVSANFGAFDLVYMLATFWTPEQRHASGREQHALRRYHAALNAADVQGYSWEQLLTDYRLMIIFMIFDPVWNQTAGSSRDYWWPKLRCLTSAFQDLRCAELLGI